jgi:hypothetical protein
MRKFIIIDDSKFPIVIYRYQKFTPTPEEFRQMQLDLETYALGHQDFVSIIDLTDLSFLPSEFRISQAKWSKRNDPMFIKQKVKFAFCTPSSIAQIMLKGVFLISKPGVPHTVVSSIDQGVAWGLEQMAFVK